MWNSTQNRSKSDLKKKKNKTKQKKTISKCNDQISWSIVLSLNVSVCLYPNYISVTILANDISSARSYWHKIVTSPNMVVQVELFVNGCISLPTTPLAPVLRTVSCCFPAVCKIPLACHFQELLSTAILIREIFCCSGYCRGKYTQLGIPNQCFPSPSDQSRTMKWVALHCT